MEKNIYYQILKLIVIKNIGGDLSKWNVQMIGGKYTITSNFGSNYNTLGVKDYSSLENARLATKHFLSDKTEWILEPAVSGKVIYCVIANDLSTDDYAAVTNIISYASQMGYTDYFYDYDYIVGDIAYSKLRLKGFYESNNKKVKNLNNIKNLDDYINNYCAKNCRYFVIKKINEKK